MGWDQEDGKDAGSGNHGCPCSQCKMKAEVVQKAAEQERAGRSYYVLAGENDSVRHSAVTGAEPFAKGQGRGAVDEGAS